MIFQREAKAKNYICTVLHAHALQFTRLGVLVQKFAARSGVLETKRSRGTYGSSIIGLLWRKPMRAFS